VATIVGTAGNDTLAGTSGNDTISGLGGNDTLVGSGGTDFYDGGTGFDTLDFRGATGIAISFSAGTVSGGFNGTFANVERVLGSSANDSISGSAGGQTLAGQGGADTLWGAGGVDNLWGGAGADTFIFRETGTGNADSVRDFTSGSDKLLLDGAVMSALGAAGNFAAGDARFKANSTGTATDASDRIVYNTTTRQVFYDADGNGSGAKVLIATLQSGATLVATDIAVSGQSQPGTIQGTSGNDSLTGTDGNDSINGLAGNDTIDGRAGNDTLDGGLGADTMIGGTGDDQFFVDDAGDVTIEQQGGLNGIDTAHASVSHTLSAWVNNLTLIGGSAIDGTGNEIDNVLTGNGAANALSGDGGNDTLTGGLGQDRFVFAAAPGVGNVDRVTDFVSGTDKLTFDNAAFTAIGTAGNFTTGDARFAAGAGFTSGRDASDRVIYDSSTGNLYYDADGSGASAAQLVATLQGVPALAATDIAVAGTGTVINGTSGNDSLTGTGGNDSINGLAGNDTIDGREGDDTIDGGDGNDILLGFSGNDSLLGAGGNDTLIGRDEDSTFFGGDGDDSIRGGKGSDRIDGGAGNDSIELNDGTGFNGSDTVDGGAGTDTLRLGFARSPVVVDLEAGTQSGGDISGGGSASLANIEWVFAGGTSDRIIGNSAANLLDGELGDDSISGGDGNDTLYGSYGADTVIGGNGNDSVFGGDATFPDDDANDQLSGGSGNDSLNDVLGDNLFAGGAGNDTLTGGSDRDVFAFSEAPGSANADTIAAGFASDFDAIRLDTAFHSNLGPSGRFASGDARFWSAAGANSGHDATDRVVYDTASGRLFYDADGDGAAPAQLIAVLQGAPVVTATDIYVDVVDPNLVMQGTAGDDSMSGASGHDTLSGLGGSDTLEGRHGDDRLNGGAGNDSLIGNAGADLLRGEDGDDTLDGASGVDRWQIEGEPTSGPDRQPIPGDTLDGGFGNDVFYVQHNDVIVDAGGIDTVLTNQVEYTLPGGFENLTYQPFGFSDGEGISVTYAGNALDNTIRVQRLWISSFAALDGGDGNDTLVGGLSADTFIFAAAPGVANADEVSGFASGQHDASDKLVLDGTVHANSGPSGNFAAGDARFAANSTGTAQDASDRVIYNTSTGQLWYDADGNGAGAAQLIATLQGAPSLAAADITIINGSGGGGGGSTINGTSGNDTLTGTSGNDTLNGLGGNDTLVGSGGTDFYDGGTGFDTLDFRGATGIAVSFSAGTVSGGFNGTFANVERVLGSSANDSISGSAGGQTLAGQGGADTLWGAGGIDTLWGGAGADRFIFRETGSANADSVRDWASGSDKVALDDAAMSALGASGNFSASDARFAAGAGFTSGRDATDRVIYNTSTGSLYYDADGSGAGAAQLIATFSGNPAVAATDIVVI